MCLRTKSAPLNFLPLSGHSHLSEDNSCVFNCSSGGGGGGGGGSSGEDGGEEVWE